MESKSEAKKSETVAMFSSKDLNLTYAQNWSIALNMRIKHRFHPTSQREQNRHFLVNCDIKYH